MDCPSSSLSNEIASAGARRIFISGDGTQVGKSSVCLGIIGMLLRCGYKSDDVAYIKPVTQCEQPQSVHFWCEANRVDCERIGPVVFYAGFTRAFLRGEAGTSASLLRQVSEAVEKVSAGKKIVIIDGVGYPSVGSICGVSNAQVAAALKASVILVGRGGVGDAVDSYNRNVHYFKAFDVPIIGKIFNKLSSGGFYSLSKCKESVNLYFKSTREPLPYGYIPDVKPLLERSFERTAAAYLVDLSGVVASINSTYVVVCFTHEAHSLDPYREYLSVLQHSETAAHVIHCEVPDNGAPIVEEDISTLPLFHLYKSGKQIRTFNPSSVEELAEMMENIDDTSMRESARRAMDFVRENSFPRPDMERSDAVLCASDLFISIFMRHVDIRHLKGDIEGLSTGPVEIALGSENVHEEYGRVRTREEIEDESAGQGGFGSCALKRDFA